MSEFKIPTEVVELPSKGLIYPKDHPLSKGEIEIKYMTAKEEDILSNEAYIKSGKVLDKLLDSLIVDKTINQKDLVVGDKNAVLIAARVLGYGKEYPISVNGDEEIIDLSILENKPFPPEGFVENTNEFEFELPHTGNKVTFKILNGYDEDKIDQELRGLRKIFKDNVPELTTRFKHIITSVNGETEPKIIRQFVDTALLARDSRSLREYIKTVQPDVNLTYELESGQETTIPIGIGFFWPDYK